jgi:hypothetical protein
MKTAVLVSGMCRQFDIAVKSWKFLNHLDCDVYFSTWKKSVQSSKVLNMHVEEDITENTILEHIPNAKIKIYDVNDFDFPGDRFYHNDKHLFLMKSSLNMIKESGVEYDMLIMTRPDNYSFYNYTPEFYSKFINEGVIYGLTPIYITGKPSEKIYFLVEYFFMGNFKTLFNVIDSLPTTMHGNIHTEFAREILKLDYYVVQLPDFNLQLIRPNVRGLKPEQITPDSVFNKFMDWGQNEGFKRNRNLI